ncbi:MAG: EamA family transporter [Gammaproteobacteria bacterium]|nr:EamA family transporter [Gammaproteobacteria bacterium]
MEFRPARALFLLVGAHALFTLLDATGKHLARDMGVPLIAFIRHGGQVLLMLAVFGPRHGRALLKTQRPRLQLYRGLAISGFTLFFFTALLRLPQAEATSINFIAPFAVMLLAGPLLGERVGRVRWLGASSGCSRSFDQGRRSIPSV